MENEIRYYLGRIKEAMQEPTMEAKANAELNNEPAPEAFKPRYIVTAVKLPTGTIELAVNTENIESKIDYILDAYDADMHLKTNQDIVMQNIMIV